MTSSAPSLAAHSGRRSLRVLIFEDNADTVLSLTMLLEAEGHEVRAFNDGKSVLGKVREFNPDAVLVDIGLPEVNGYDLARILRGVLDDDCPVLIAVTAYASPADRATAEVVGFDNHVAKPYDPNVILGLLRPLAGRAR